MSIRDHRTGYAYNRRNKLAKELWNAPRVPKYNRERLKESGKRHEVTKLRLGDDFDVG